MAVQQLGRDQARTLTDIIIVLEVALMKPCKGLVPLLLLLLLPNRQ
jgi:hypothetical protein